MNKDTLREIFGKGPVAYHSIFAKITGSATAGIFLSQAFHWCDKGKTDLGEDWFFKTREEWEDETYLSRFEQEYARKKLKNLGILEEKLYGMPAKVHYKLNLDVIWKLISNYSNPNKIKVAENWPTSLLETDQQAGGKLTNKLATLPPTGTGLNVETKEEQVEDTERTTKITSKITTESDLSENNTEKEKEREKLEIQAYSLFLDWREIQENLTNKRIKWGGIREKHIIARLKEGWEFNDIRLAVRGMLTDDFCQKQGLNDIDWVCNTEWKPDRLERYKNLAVKKGITPDAPIRKSNNYSYERNDRPKIQTFEDDRI